MSTLDVQAGHVTVAVIGGGQAGLPVSWYLGQAGIDHIVLEAQTPAHAWADTRWDNFTLVTPNWHCQLPGYAYQGDDPDGFMTRDEVVDWLEGWLQTFTPPVLTHASVTSLRPLATGGFDLSLQTVAGEESLTCDHAVVATGGNQVSTYLLVGLGEDPEELIAGAAELIEIGVYPFVVPFRPHPGTLAVDVDGARAPDTATVEKVSREVAAALRMAGMAGADQKAGCASCGACGVLQSVGG